MRSLYWPVWILTNIGLILKVFPLLENITNLSSYASTLTHYKDQQYSWRQILTLDMNIGVGQFLILYGNSPWRLQSIHHNTSIVPGIGLSDRGSCEVGGDGLPGIVQLLPFHRQGWRIGVHGTVKVQLTGLIDYNSGWDGDNGLICNNSTHKITVHI